jgi:hypothetical protein
MRTLLITLALLALSLRTSYSQINCELSQEMEQEFTETTSPMNYCYDIGWVQANCVNVYVNVNVHFFLDDNCEGTVATAPGVSGDLTPQNAFYLAEKMIDDANAFLQAMSENNQWNSQYHNTPVTGPQCVPIRYVLSGVRIHCNSAAQSTGVSFNDFNPFEVNGASEINVYVSNIIENTNANGFANNTLNDAAVEEFSPGIFNHELGHVFNLIHAFTAFDQCDDTWYYNWSWDLDCDGTPDQTGNNCWYSEVEYNGQDACDINNFCTTHPCCEWSAQNNNLMAYSAWAGNPNYSALTPCQVSRMLTDISDNMCDFVEDVNSACPPPKAFIGTIPTIDGSTECPTCFYMNASYNESLYEVEIVDQNNTTIIETGEISKEAGKYCIRPGYDQWGNPYWPNGFQSGQSYTIRLTVYNECGDSHSDALTFTLPDPCGPPVAEPQPPNFKIKNLSPNPTAGLLTLEFDVLQDGNLQIYGLHSNSGYFYGEIKNEYFTVGDGQTSNLDASNWVTGTNTLIFQFEDEVYIENFIKQ